MLGVTPPRHPGEPPAGLAVRSTRREARLTWTAPREGTVDRYAVYRGIADAPWGADFEIIGSTRRTRFVDRELPPRGIAHYFVTAQRDGVRESRGSLKVRTQPRAPREPVASYVPAKGVRILWEKSAEKDVAGYHVYRGLGRPGYAKPLPEDGYAGGFERITTQPNRSTRYLDPVEEPSRTAYLITAVNERGIETQDNHDKG